MSAPVEFHPADVPIDPYALGLLLGDDCLTTKTTPSFTTADPELADALEAALPGIELRRKGAVDYVLRHAPCQVLVVAFPDGVFEEDGRGA